MEGSVSRWLCLAGGVAWLAAAGATVAADDADWSTRLLQQKARIERVQKQLDAADAAYAKGLAANVGAAHLRGLREERDEVAVRLAEAERALPALVQAARDDGVAEAILRPYRFVSRPAASPAASR